MPAVARRGPGEPDIHHPCHHLGSRAGESASTLDLGTGMPIRPAAGDAARAVIPDARIAYIDHDPFVTMHAEVLLADDEGIAVADADLTDPASVLARPEVRAVIDPAEPVCLVLGLVLGLMPVRQARDVVAGYADLIAPGSYVVISCGRCDDEVLWKELSEAYTAAGSYNHSPAEITGFLAGLKLVPPGLVAAQNWRGGWHHVPASGTGSGVRAGRGREEVTAGLPVREPSRAMYAHCDHGRMTPSRAVESPCQPASSPGDRLALAACESEDDLLGWLS